MRGERLMKRMAFDKMSFDINELANFGLEAVRFGGERLGKQ